MNNTIVLHNDELEVHIEAKGAEVSRIYSKKYQREILWDADPKFWGRHAPVLFPIVGKIKNNQYTIAGNTYELTQHGFARDCEFDLCEQNQLSVRFSLSENENTLKKYPFNFRLEAIYQLKNNQLSVSYNVVNTGDENLFFSLGAHPAFNCPSASDLSLEDYEIKFSENEKSSILLLSSNGLISENRQEFFKDDCVIKLNEQLFQNDALIFDDLKSQELIIQSNKDTMKLKISWKNFPHLGIWKPIGAPFLCIEPWQGMADFEEHNGNLEEKYGIVKLAQKQSHFSSYKITIE